MMLDGLSMDTIRGFRIGCTCEDELEVDKEDIEDFYIKAMCEWIELRPKKRLVPHYDFVTDEAVEEICTVPEEERFSAYRMVEEFAVSIKPAANRPLDNNGFGTKTVFERLSLHDVQRLTMLMTDGAEMIFHISWDDFDRIEDSNQWSDIREDGCLVFGRTNYCNEE